MAQTYCQAEKCLVALELRKGDIQALLPHVQLMLCALCSALPATRAKVVCGPGNLAHPCRPHDLYELLQLCEAGVLGVWNEVHAAGCTGIGRSNSSSNISQLCSRCKAS